MNKLAYILIGLLFTTQAFSNNLEKLVGLDGAWSFTVGDNPEWSNADFDASSWDKLFVPNWWEEYYPNYNGFGWYRKSFQMRWIPEEGEIFVNLGFIDDVDEVFLNGIKIGQSGEFFPNFSTAFDIERWYVVPRELLNKGENTIAIRVYDTAGAGGIIRGNRIGIHYDTDYSLLALDLSGLWKFNIDRDGNVYDEDYDDSSWDEIQVPAFWESQGYNNVDGYAWYRKKFSLPNNLKGERLYLVLGKIDDFDKVYLNGELIARTEYLDAYSSYNKANAYRLYRVYRIPLNALKANNVLVVQVRDNGLSGGIYEGPIGIMLEQDAQIILERNRDDFWDNPFEYILRSIFN